MDEDAALELIDAHLDHEPLTQEQAHSLAVWLNDKAEHADSAFHRIFLHTFLRQRLQGGVLLAPSGLVLHTQPTIEVDGSSTSISDEPGEIGQRGFLTILPPWGWCLALCLMGTAGFFAARAIFQSTLAPTELYAYEGFDYPPTTPPAPLGDGNKWPTSGGMQGLAGGFGWREPWQEAAPKVSVLVADTMQNAWRATDMRKFGPLGYADAHGNVLKTSGIQMRTAAGPLSTTLRTLSREAFPPAMTDAEGLGSDGSVLWLSLLAQSFDGRGLGNFAYLELGSGAAGFRLGKVASVPSGNWSATGVLDGAELNFRWSDVPSGQAVFFVARITFRPGGEEADIWINPLLDSEPETSTAALHVSLPDFRFDRVSISSRYTTDFDEFRLGGSFRDVTPIR